MAKKHNNKAQTPARKAEDTIVYKALVILCVLAIGILLLQAVSRNYAFVEKYEVWNRGLLWCSIITAILTVAGIGLAIWKKGLLRNVSIGAACGFAIVAISAWCLYRFWYLPLPYLYFLLIAGCALALISLLYPKDFTTMALIGTVSGGTFFLHGQNGAASLGISLLYALSAVLILVTVLLSIRAAKHGGKLTYKNKTIRLFGGKAGPLPLYAACMVLATCQLAAMILGGLFAHYCVYAVAGGLFIAACYYTIRLD